MSFSAGCGAGPTQPAPTATRTIPTLGATPMPSPVPLTPTATRTPPPGPRAFTEEFSSTLNYWSFLEVDNGQPFAGPRIQDGFLVFELNSSNQWAYGVYGGHDYGDVTVTAQLQSRTAGDGAAGLICRYDASKGWYEFNIYADRSYELLYGQWLAQGVARYAPLYQGDSDAIQSDENQIGLDCQGSQLTPFVNGTQLRTWPELKFALAGGKIGVAVSSFEDVPFTIAFDWLKVEEP